MLRFKKTDPQALVEAVPPDSELQLVHDQGVYIMSFMQPVGQRTIIYAEGCHPEKDTDWWETSRRLVGDDDFGEPFATAAQVKTLLAAARSYLTIRVTESQIITETE